MVGVAFCSVFAALTLVELVSAFSGFRFSLVLDRFDVGLCDGDRFRRRLRRGPHPKLLLTRGNRLGLRRRDLGLGDPEKKDRDNRLGRERRNLRLFDARHFPHRVELCLREPRVRGHVRIGDERARIE